MVRNPPANAEDEGLVLGLGRSPWGSNGNPLQYPCLGNPMDSGAWQAMEDRVSKNQTRLSDWVHTHTQSLIDSQTLHHKYNPCLSNFKLIKHSTNLGFWWSLPKSSVFSLSSCDSEISLIFTQSINYLCFSPMLAFLILGSPVLSSLDLISFYWHIPPVAS